VRNLGELAVEPPAGVDETDGEALAGDPGLDEYNSAEMQHRPELLTRFGCRTH
jgi:hypothetical protein